MKLAMGDALLLARVLKAHSLRIREGNIEQRCSRCLTFLPARDEYFPPHRVQLSGLASWCRDCKAAHGRQRRRMKVTA